MRSPLNGLLDRIRPQHYGRKHPLVLINGLAEQAESWYRNRRFWATVLRRALARTSWPTRATRCTAGSPPASRSRSITWSTQLHTYLDQFVQTPPYHLVSSSLGGQGRGRVRGPLPRSRGARRAPLPVGDGRQGAAADHRGRRAAATRTRWSGASSTSRASPTARCSGTTSRSSSSRKWKTGFLKTVRGTLDHTVRERLQRPARARRCWSPARTTRSAARRRRRRRRATFPLGHFRKIEKCGHAPQIEKHWLDQPSGRTLPQFANADRASVLDPTHPREADPSNTAMTTATPAADPKSNPNLPLPRRTRRMPCSAGTRLAHRATAAGRTGG